MKTTFDVIDAIASKLSTEPLKAAINGDVYKHKRPVDSRKVDVVINCLPVNNEQLQEALFNVNIHAPNLVLNIDGKEDTTQPDHVTLKNLSGIAITQLNNIEGEDYCIEIQQQQMFEEAELKEHYLNIRVEFYSPNV